MSPEMIGVLVGLLGIAVMVSLYFIGRRHGRQDREQQEREARIERVTRAYIGLGVYTSGAHGLILAGVRDLRDDTEIREALGRIEDRTGKAPLGRYAERLADADLAAFFRQLQMERNTVPNLDAVVQQFSQRERE